MFLVYITCKNFAEAKKIAKFLLEKRIIGCANIVPKIFSMYLWNKKIKSESETLLLCKTVKKKISKIKSEVKKIHSYEVPCIEFIKISDQNPEYLDWLNEEIVKK